jgi:hypothetical protein
MAKVRGLVYCEVNIQLEIVTQAPFLSLSITKPD